jgi:CRP-like cAMP-binding protein
MDIHKVLKQYDLFNKLNQTALDRLSSNAYIRRFQPKVIIFNEGFGGDYFYLLLNGSIRIYKTSYEGKESTIKIIRPGEIFAEGILFYNNKYPVSAVAAESSELLALHRDSFWEMIEDTESRRTFIASIFEKLRFLTDQIHFLTTSDVEDRFFRFLISTYGKKYRYDISLPKKDIASAIGTIPETFSRLLLRLTKTGTLAWKKNTLIIREGFWENDYFD